MSDFCGWSGSHSPRVQAWAEFLVSQVVVISGQLWKFWSKIARTINFPSIFSSIDQSSHQRVINDLLIHSSPNLHVRTESPCDKYYPCTHLCSMVSAYERSLAGMNSPHVHTIFSERFGELQFAILLWEKWSCVEFIWVTIRLQTHPDKDESPSMIYAGPCDWTTTSESFLS